MISSGEIEFKSTILKKFIATYGFRFKTQDNFFRIPPFLLSNDAKSLTASSQAILTRFYLGLFSATTFQPS